MNEYSAFTVRDSVRRGFGMFSAGHFAWLLAGALFGFFLCRIYCGRDKKTRRLIRLAVAWSAVAVELLRALLLAADGDFGIDRLPLHLCGLAIYISLFHALCGTELSGQFLYGFCLPGALSALIFPDWNGYPLLHFMTVCGFVLHFLIVTYVLMQTVSGDLVPDIKKTPACLCIMLALAVPVYVFDILTGTNYMFLNWPSEGSPLEWFEFLGRPGYVLGYLPLLLSVWAVMYCPFRKAKVK